MPTVSICIVTYNSEQDISSCIDAVMKQTYPIYRIVIVDNASSDRSVQIVQEKINEGAPILLIQNEHNNGFAGGQNQAIGATRTDYVLVLNPDVTLYANYISELITQLEQNEKAGSATGLLLRKSDPSIVDSTGLAMGNNRHAVDRGAGEMAKQWSEAGIVFGVSGAAAMYKRKMIEQVSINGEFFDEQFFAYKEDVDVAWRANLLGFHAYYVPAAKALHARGWKEGQRRLVSQFVRQHSYVNQIFLIVKNEPLGWHLLKIAPILLFREIAKLGYILIKERDLLGSWAIICRQLPNMFKKRKLIQIKRKTLSST